MKRQNTLLLVAGLSAMIPLAAVIAQESVMGLRGDAALDAQSLPAAVYKQLQVQRFKRAFRQQPPLVPYEVDSFQIDLKANACLSCHDWPGNVEVDAPKASETHYMNRDSVALDQVSRERWFCTQCHVPQKDTDALVQNTFQPAKLNP
ncbi:MAG: nitrate reductase cytochrome c-type subunit [Hyphomicrobiales bacterium]|nr:nitrate reductase cytochrome c-type subunit [Hyphomicrobiales bacterium]